MYKKRNLEGKRFGKMTVIKSVGYRLQSNRHFYSLVRCDCGNEFYIQDTKLVNGYQTQCPICSNNSKKTHGMSGRKGKYGSLYTRWACMKGRCLNKNNQDYKDYGGRGIRVCDEWLGKDGFENFFKWSIENGFRQDLSLDRINVNGNYEPSNCRWATVIQQARNKRTTIYISYEGEKKTCKELEEITGIKAGTIRYRILSGWSEYDATHTPTNSEMSKKISMSNLRVKKAKVSLINKENGEVKRFMTLKEASAFLGHGDGYLTVALSRGRREIGKYYVEKEEYYY